MSDYIELTVKKFRTLMKRKDIKSPQWFAIEYDILTHPDFLDITGDQFKAYVWVVGIATKLNNPKIRVYPELCARQINIAKNDVLVTIEKLNTKRWDVTHESRTRNASVPLHYTTLHNTTKESVNALVDSDPSPTRSHWLVDLWNINRKKLPKIRLPISPKRLKGIKSRVKENPEKETWVEAITRLAESDFANGGGSTAWVASFDWFIRPDSLEKVLEGKYDNRRKLSANELTIAKLQNDENEGGFL